MHTTLRNVSNLNWNITSTVGDILGGLYDFTRPIDVPKIVGSLKSTMDQMKTLVYGYLDMIPVEWEAETFDGTSPLAVYFRTREVLSTAKSRVDYFDRYMNRDIFDLYLRDLPSNLSIRLVTTRGTGDYGVVHLEPVARLAKAELQSFQLVEVDPKNMHDRKLRIDDQIFVIGSGITLGAKHPEHANEFAPADSSPKGHAELDALIRSGTLIV